APPFCPAATTCTSRAVRRATKCRGDRRRALYDIAGRHQRGYCQRRQGRSRVARHCAMPPGLSRGGSAASAVGAGSSLSADAATPPAAGCGGHWTGHPAARSGAGTPAAGSAVWRARGGDGGKGGGGGSWLVTTITTTTPTPLLGCES